MASQEPRHDNEPVMGDAGIGAPAGAAGMNGAPEPSGTPSSPVIMPTVRPVDETDEPTPSRLRVAWWSLQASDWRTKAATAALVLACLLAAVAVSQAIWRATTLYGVDQELQQWALNSREADNDLPSSALLGDDETATDEGAAAGDGSSASSGTTTGNNAGTTGNGSSAGTTAGGQNASGNGTQDGPSSDASDDVDPTPDPGQPDDGKDDPSADEGRWTGYY